MRIVNSTSNNVHIKTVNGFHSTWTKGDIDPKKIANFATIRWKIQDKSKQLDIKLDGNTVFYTIELDEYRGSYEIGITSQLGKQFYAYYGGISSRFQKRNPGLDTSS